MHERHAFIGDGTQISKEAFTAAAITETQHDQQLKRFIHMHKWAPLGDYTCNDGCTVIYQGNVTQVEHSTVLESPVQ